MSKSSTRSPISAFIIRPFSGGATVSCSPWITSNGVLEPAFHQPRPASRASPRSAPSRPPDTSRRTTRSRRCQGEERERHVGQALGVRPVEAEAAEQRLGRTGLHRRLAAGRDHGHRLDQLGPVGGERAADALAERMADYDDRLAAERLDHECCVGGKVVQREAVHRPRALADPARIRTDGREPGRDEATAEVVEIRRASSQRGDHQDGGSRPLDLERYLPPEGRATRRCSARPLGGEAEDSFIVIVAASM